MQQIVIGTINERTLLQRLSAVVRSLTSLGPLLLRTVAAVFLIALGVGIFVGQVVVAVVDVATGLGFFLLAMIFILIVRVALPEHVTFTSDNVHSSTISLASNDVERVEIVDSSSDRSTLTIYHAEGRSYSFLIRKSEIDASEIRELVPFPVLVNQSEME